MVVEQGEEVRAAMGEDGGAGGAGGPLGAGGAEVRPAFWFLCTGGIAAPPCESDPSPNPTCMPSMFGRLGGMQSGRAGCGVHVLPALPASSKHMHARLVCRKMQLALATMAPRGRRPQRAGSQAQRGIMSARASPC